MTLQISIVIPVYNEEENILPLYRKLKDDISSLGRTYEIIFIDDGSTDSTFTKLKEIQAEDVHIRIVNSGEISEKRSPSTPRSDW